MWHRVELEKSQSYWLGQLEEADRQIESIEKLKSAWARRERLKLSKKRAEIWGKVIALAET